MKRNASQDKATAFHEAGHAIVACDQKIRVKAISIEPGQGFDGYVSRPRSKLEKRFEYDRSDKIRLMCERYARISLAGGIAQRKFNPRSWRHYHAHSDNENVVSVISHLVSSDKELNAWRKLLVIQTSQIVENHWHEISALAEHLIKVHYLSGAEFYRWYSSLPQAIRSK